MSGTLRFLFADHLSRSVSSLKGLDAERDVVLMVEAADEATYVPHHKKEIAFLFSAMRHFAEQLHTEGVRVDYVRLDEPGNTGSFRGELRRALARHGPHRVVVTEPGEYRVLQDMLDWQDALGVNVEMRPDDRFLCSREAFAHWADGRKQLRMEFFYRDLRRRHGLLLDRAAEPEGGAGTWMPRTVSHRPTGSRRRGRGVFGPIRRRATCWRWSNGAFPSTSAISSRSGSP